MGEVRGAHPARMAKKTAWAGRRGICPGNNATTIAMSKGKYNFLVILGIN
jgi:hypothetical protein